MNDHDKLIEISTRMEDVIKKLDQIDKKLENYNLIKHKVENTSKWATKWGSLGISIIVAAITAFLTSYFNVTLGK